jgi:hypothetical protein
MGRLRPENLHVRFADGAEPDGPLTPRRYTLTHSDATGDLYLTIGPDYDRQQLAGWQVRFMRDEVLAELRQEKDGPSLHVDCHVSGGLVLGPTRWRDAIFRQELPLALEAICFGDQRLFECRPDLIHSPIWVHFHATEARYDRTERWGTVREHLYSSGRPEAGL